MQTELERLKTENQNLDTHRLATIPNVRVKYQSFLSAIDGKVMNALADNDNCAKCPFCTIDWNDVMDDLKEVEFSERFIEEVHSLARNCCDTPLHMIINTLVMVCKVGFRNIKGCRKFQKRFTPTQNIRKGDNEKRLRKILKQAGFPIFETRKGGRGNANDGEYIKDYLTPFMI